MRFLSAAFVLFAATPSQALIRFDSAAAFFSAPSYGSEDFFPGLGSTGRSIDISNIGGCEGADETGERCGAYETSGFTLVLGTASFAYTAGLRQDHASPTSELSTDIAVSAMFRADREMYLRPRELRSLSSPFCGSCSNSFTSNIRQVEQSDGSWLATIEVGTSAATREGVQRLSHQLNVDLAEVPEPQSWAMMIMGFGLVGAMQRRRHQFRQGGARGRI